MIDQNEKARLKEMLLSEKARIEKELAGVARRDPRAADKLNWEATLPEMSDDKGRASSTLEESADEVEEFETRLETEDALEGRLRDIADALSIIDTSGYGICARCGKAIPLERLRANPAARFDIEHSN